MTAIADQSPKGGDPQGLHAKHASGGAEGNRPNSSAPPSHSTVEVTQADRDAAADLFKAGGNRWWELECREGNWQLHKPCVDAVLAFARHRIASRTPAQGTDGTLADEIEATIERYHDAMPQGQGESGDPVASHAIALEMARLLYNNSETIVAALQFPAQGTDTVERVERAIELRRYLYGGEPLNVNERGIVEGIRTAVLAAISPPSTGDEQ